MDIQVNQDPLDCSTSLSQKPFINNIVTLEYDSKDIFEILIDNYLEVFNHNQQNDCPLQ